MNITQTKKGVQPRAYADHVYEWIIVTDTDSCTWEWCRENVLQDRDKIWLSQAIPKEEYITKRRSRMDFNERMQMICKGYYSISKMGECEYCLRIVQEYID